MSSFTLLGLTLTQTLLVLGAILMVVDLFFLSDLPTLAAYFVFAAAIALQFDVPPLVGVLVGLLAFVALIVFHYAVWRGVIRRFSEKVAPAKFQGSVERVVGQRGVIRRLEGRSLVSVGGELWSHDGEPGWPDGTPVEVVGRAEGTLQVRLLRSAHPGQEG